MEIANLRSYWITLCGLVVGVALFGSSPAPARTHGWSAEAWATDPPFDEDQKKLVPTQYRALGTGEVSRKWPICVLLAHTGSEYWVSYTYGVVDEAKRQNASLTIFSAGGYANVPGQIRQLEDCVTRGSKAIILVATSPAGLNPAISEARRKGVVIVDVGNGVTTDDIDARVLVSYRRAGFVTGRFLADKHPAGSGKVQMLYLAGPPGAAYIERLRQGVYTGLAGSDVEVVKDLYAASNKAAQLKLVEDGLLAYPNIKYIVGVAAGIEAALDVLRERGRKDILLISTLPTPTVWDAVATGQALGLVTDSVVTQARMAIDLALRILEKKPFVKDIAPDLLMISVDNVKSADRSPSLFPPGWKIVFNLD